MLSRYGPIESTREGTHISLRPPPEAAPPLEPDHRAPAEEATTRTSPGQLPRRSPSIFERAFDKVFPPEGDGGRHESSSAGIEEPVSIFGIPHWISCRLQDWVCRSDDGAARYDPKRGLDLEQRVKEVLIKAEGLPWPRLPTWDVTSTWDATLTWLRDAGARIESWGGRADADAAPEPPPLNWRDMLPSLDLTELLPEFDGTWFREVCPRCIGSIVSAWVLSYGAFRFFRFREAIANQHRRHAEKRSPKNLVLNMQMIAVTAERLCRFRRRKYLWALPIVFGAYSCTSWFNNQLGWRFFLRDMKIQNPTFVSDLELPGSLMSRSNPDRVIYTPEGQVALLQVMLRKADMGHQKEAIEAMQQDVRGAVAAGLQKHVVDARRERRSRRFDAEEQLTLQAWGRRPN